MAADATGEAETGPLRLHHDRTIKLAFQGSSISSDCGLLLHRELDDALGLTDMAAEMLFDPRTGKRRFSDGTDAPDFPANTSQPAPETSNPCSASTKSRMQALDGSRSSLISPQRLAYAGIRKANGKSALRMRP